MQIGLFSWRDLGRGCIHCCTPTTRSGRLIAAILVATIPIGVVERLRIAYGPSITEKEFQNWSLVNKFALSLLGIAMITTLYRLGRDTRDLINSCRELRRVRPHRVVELVVNSARSSPDSSQTRS